jgi:hypothetical protein
MSFVISSYPQVGHVVNSVNGVSGNISLQDSDTIQVVKAENGRFKFELTGSNPGGGTPAPNPGGTFTGFPVPAFKRKVPLEGFTVGSYILPPEDGWVQAVKSGPQAGTIYQLQVNDVTVWQAETNVSYDIYSPLIPVKGLDYVSNTQNLVSFIFFYPVRTEEEGNEGMA